MWIGEHGRHRTLVKMGFASRLEELDSYTADCFIEISREIDNLEREEMNKKKG